MDYIGDLRKIVGKTPLIMVGANVIIINERNEILLHHRTDRDWWGLPGGAMELGESLEETARRETLEEVNLLCGKLELFNIYSGKSQYYKYPDGNEVYNVTATYICKNYTGILEVEKTEGKDAKFYNLNSLPNNISSTIVEILEDFKNKGINN